LIDYYVLSALLVEVIEQIDRRIDHEKVSDLDGFNIPNCLVAGPISGLYSRSASDFVKLTGELDSVLRYEVETAASEEV